MAVKVALAALVSLGFTVVLLATAHVLLAESTANASATDSVVAADCSCSTGADCEDANRRSHLAWNAASWLVGLGLVVGAGRRTRARAAAE